MRDPLYRLPVTYKLILAFAGVCLLTFGVGGYVVFNWAEHEIERRVSAHISTGADLAAEMTARRLEQQAGELRDLRALLDADGALPGLESLHRSFGPSLLGVESTDWEGAVTDHMGSLPLSTPPPETLSSRGHLFEDPASGAAVLLLAATGRDGILVAAFDAKSWSDLPAEVELPDYATVRLAGLPGGDWPSDTHVLKRELPGSTLSLEIGVPWAYERSLQTDLKSRFLAAAILIALGSAVLLLFPLRFLARPLRTLTDATRRIQNGELDQPVQMASGDELGELGAAFNAMAEGMAERNRQIEEAAQALRRERDRLRAAVDTMPDGLVFLDKNGEVLLSNAAAEPIRRLMVDFDRNSRVRLCHTSTTPDCMSCMNSPKTNHASCMLESRDRIFEVLSTPIHGPGGEREGKIILARDITDRLALNERQSHHEMLATVGRVAAVVAHELNNPLAAVSMYAQMMEDEVPEGSPWREHLEVIRRNTDNCKRSVKELLEHARMPQAQVEETSIHDVILDAGTFLKPLLQKGGVELGYALEATQPLLNGDEGQLRQVFVNLFMNAMQAMEKGGTVTVITRDVPDADAVEVDVVDDGPGVPAAVRERIFAPFFTTKAPGRGTGLGLSTSQSIAENHGGSLTLFESAPGRTVFRLRLPRHAARPQNTAAAGDISFLPAESLTLGRKS